MRALLALLLLVASAAQADEQPKLRLYFLPTYPVRLDWSAPNKLIESAINALIRNRSEPIGHVTEEIDCGDGYPKLTGAIGAGAGPISNLLLNEQVGFSLLERGWPGAIETHDHVMQVLQFRGTDPNQMSVVTFLISAKTCARLQEYLTQYAAETKPVYYGFAPRPRHKEGSGCSAFGASFTEIAGIFTPELYEAWTTRRNVPLTLMAGHGRDAIPINDLRNSAASQRWTTENEAHMDLTFFDPDRMYEWAKHLAEHPDELAKQGGTLQPNLPYGIKGVPSIQFDRTDVPTPDEPLFNGEPSLQPKGPSSVERTDVRYGADGSFVIKP